METTIITDPGMPVPEQPKHEYAGFWMRYGAAMIDTVIIAFAVSTFYSYLYPLLDYYVELVKPKKTDDLYGSSFNDKYEMVRKMTIRSTLFFAAVFNWLYYASFECSPWRGTPGKKLLGIWVTDMDGKRLTFGTATGRYFAKIISGMILYIGFMMAGFTQKKQALHDQMAGALVWKK